MIYNIVLVLGAQQGDLVIYVYIYIYIHIYIYIYSFLRILFHGLENTHVTLLSLI